MMIGRKLGEGNRAAIIKRVETEEEMFRRDVIPDEMVRMKRRKRGDHIRWSPAMTI